MVAAGLPMAVRNNRQDNYPSVYKTELQYGVADQLIYELGLYHSTILNFTLAKEEEKVIGLKVKYYETAEQATPAKTGEFKYIIQKSDLVDADSHLWKLTTQLDKKVAGEYSFPKEYPANLGFLCIPSSFVKILDNKDSVLVSIPYPPVSSSYDSDGGDCFLTTACVHHKGLPDDCDELSMLRFLRDEYMLQNKEGREMIQQYKKLGPEIVKAINSCENRAAIYEYMYEHMILPSVQLVKEGNYSEATTFYKTFVKSLKRQYC